MSDSRRAVGTLEHQVLYMYFDASKLRSANIKHEIAPPM